ncbi:MAG: GGDEF domain-containing protein [Pseudohongiella sp.]|nr:GGDEF domain-containing protein [Pseudohongiella sp.]
MNQQARVGNLNNEFEQIRNKRVGQTIGVLLLALFALAFVNLLSADNVVVPVLLFAILFLSFAFFLLRRGYTQAAATITLVVMFVCIAQAMWSGSGLRSSALLVFPAAQLFALIMIGKRAFYLSYLSMLAYMVILLTANTQGWRVGAENMLGYRWMLDFGILLTAATFVMRVLATDLLAMLAALRVEMTEITQSRIAAEHLANHDTLTGLPNRRMAEQYFSDMFDQAMQERSGMALIFVDVDNFKDVNDTHGHQCGDDLLKHIGEVISSQLRRTDRLTRIAGDEFLILLPGVSVSQEVEVILRKIKHSVSMPVTLGGETLSPTLSMGIALAPAHGDDFKSLLSKADQALYQSKAAGRNRYHYFQPAL